MELPPHCLWWGVGGLKVAALMAESVCAGRRLKVGSAPCGGSAVTLVAPSASVGSWSVMAASGSRGDAVAVGRDAVAR